MSKEQKNLLWIYLGLTLGTLFVFWPVTGFEFVNFDDTDFITANPHVQAGMTWDSIKWAFNLHTEVARNWHPITMLTHMLDCQLFGLNAGRHHLVNVLYHTANTLLLFFVLRRMNGALWRSAFVAALFAWHPLHVESVAWMAERKDVLSTFFWLLVMWAYGRYAEEFKVQGSKFKGGACWLWYGLSVVFCALGLMSKPMLVTMPFVLLLLDYWPLARMKSVTPVKGKAVAARPSIGWLVFEKIPFFVLSAALCWITFNIQKQGGAMLNSTNLPIGPRVSNALISYVRYIGNMFWPHNLAGLYLRDGEWPMWKAVSAALLLLVITVIVVLQARRRNYLAMGWFWYAGTLVPVIGLVQVGMQAMADRFTYVPLIGLFILVAWGGWELAQAKKVPAVALGVLMGAICVVCMGLTRVQLQYWKDSKALFTRMVTATPKNYMAYYNLGNYYSREDNLAEAVNSYKKAVEYEPNYANAHNNLGGVLLREKNFDEAILHYKRATEIIPEYLHFFNLANALGDAGRLAEAEDTYRKALSLDPNAADAYNNFGMVLNSDKKPDEAIASFRAALRIRPDFELVEFNLANTYSAAGKLEDAITHYAAAVRLNPQRLESYNGLGISYAMQNKMDEAAKWFRELLKVKPDDSGALSNLGNALSAQGKFSEATEAYLTALRLNPKDAQVHYNVGISLSQQGKKEEAIEYFKEALVINPSYPEAQRALESLQKGR